MLKFYLAKGLVDKMELDGLADRMGVPSQVLRDEAATYAAAAMAGTDGFGKGVFPSSLDVSQPLYVAKITPVVHYCMGGVAIDSDAEVLDESGTPIAGLFAAGEVAGGVHGSNRLGGNSLLECVVFGMHAGSNALAHAALSLRVEL
jgi:succinate dehydrogenase/fumarate reductase flavoprotein subunit